jgi:tetratricopeptide (TPR) repeat protein
MWTLLLLVLWVPCGRADDNEAHAREMAQMARRSDDLRTRAMANAYYLRSAYMRHRALQGRETRQLTPAAQEGIADAVFFLERALEFAPESRYLWWESAALNSSIGRIAGVIAAYEHLVAIEPRIELVLKLGDLYQLRGDAERAVEQYSRALAATPGSAIILERIADVYIEEGFQAQRRDDLELANAHFRAALARLQTLARTNAKARVLVKQGVLYQLVNEDARALTAFRAALARDPGNQDACMRAAQLLFTQGDQAERAGAADEARNRYAEAAALLANVVPNSRLQPEMLNFAAYVFAVSGTNLQTAEGLVTQALEHDDSNGAYLDTLGWIYYQRGEAEQALTKVQRALELEGDDAVIIDHLGDIYLRLGQPEKARALWRKSLQLDANNKTVARKLQDGR